MEWTDADKALCSKIAGEVIKEVMQGHIKDCPHHQEYEVDQKLLANTKRITTRMIAIILPIGVVLGSAIAAGGTTAVVIKVLTQTLMTALANAK